MRREDAEAIVEHLKDDPTVSVADLAGGFWGVEVQTDFVDQFGEIIYLEVGSDDDGNVLLQPFTYGGGQLTDDYVALGLRENEHQAVADALRDYGTMDIRDILSMAKPQ